MEPNGPLWEVVGGQESGGILVRAEQSLSSPQEPSLLSTGALIEELDLVEHRLRFKRLSGTGPATGWVSVRTKSDKVLVEECPPDMVPPIDPSSQGVVILALMAAHVRTKQRATRLYHALSSIQAQELPPGVEFVPSVSWSVAGSEILADVQQTIESFEGLVAVHQTTKHSQFEHLRAAMHQAEEEVRRRGGAGDRSIWIIFGDDDDIWHPRRVAELVNAIRDHPLVDAVAGFCTANRANCVDSRGAEADSNLPCTMEQVEDFLRVGRGYRMELGEVYSEWYDNLKEPGSTEVEAIPEDIFLEYFDFCPRLRIFREFFQITSTDIIQHKYCDLRFGRFLMQYPLSGKELGLELSVFKPDCWMYFYACANQNEFQFMRSLEAGDSMGQAEQMSSSIKADSRDTEMAEKVLAAVQEYERDISATMLARYFAMFHFLMDMWLIPAHTDKLDQRVFDFYVYMAASNSFGKLDFFVFACRKSSKKFGEVLCQLGHEFAAGLAKTLGVDILWHTPGRFMWPEVKTSSMDTSIFPQPNGACPVGKKGSQATQHPGKNLRQTAQAGGDAANRGSESSSDSDEDVFDDRGRGGRDGGYTVADRARMGTHPAAKPVAAKPVSRGPPARDARTMLD
eukprot:gnl/TRDRNA2_/TRDRNA2_170506_c0_seq2.p1 gnl/TRDRNA2_/TRDRNA2_170506_c0~~gnl/TRDRNA2_/TRDRNA2_170506_c0_seq2.p1  ORF type:complete len:690 (+),score=111.81 gnl/TRDRNA2_/TRDRNA2_170506_c0_seq2:197-2071(+)